MTDETISMSKFEVGQLVKLIITDRIASYIFYSLYVYTYISISVYIFVEVAAIMQEKDEEKKEKLKQTLINETAPYYLERLDKIAEENGGHFVNKKVS